jgi:hypothetical protein
MRSRHSLGAYPIYPSHHDRLRRSFGRVYVGRAGPCWPEVGRVQAEVDGYLEARASAGPYAEESRRALMNPQPTPASIAAAEEAVGDLDAARRLRMLSGRWRVPASPLEPATRAHANRLWPM